MNIVYRDGLLFTSITITFDGKSKNINNIVIDTGASQSLVSQDLVNDIGIKVSAEDDIVTSYGIGGKEHAFIKTVQKIQVGEFVAENISIDFTNFQYSDVNGLLGLDILLNAGFIIDLKNLNMEIR